MTQAKVLTPTEMKTCTACGISKSAMFDFQIQHGKKTSNNPRPKSQCRKCINAKKHKRDKESGLRKKHQKQSYNRHKWRKPYEKHLRYAIRTGSCPPWARTGLVAEQIRQFYQNTPSNKSVVLIYPNIKRMKGSIGLFIPSNLTYMTKHELFKHYSQTFVEDRTTINPPKISIPKPTSLICTHCEKDKLLIHFSPRGKRIKICIDCGKIRQRNAGLNMDPSIRYLGVIKASVTNSNKAIQRRAKLINDPNLNYKLLDRKDLIKLATPVWARKGHIAKQIRKVYADRPNGFQVDHIHPIRGENFVGLHVPWNLQYLPAAENNRKHNKLLDIYK